MSAVALLSLAVASGFVGCGGGTGGAPQPRTQQFVLDPAGSTSNAGVLLMGVSRDSIDANNADRIDVFARVLDPQGSPIAGLPIQFQASFSDVRFLGAAENPADEIPTGVQFTDGTGTATITVQAGGTPGRLAITARAPINFALGGIIFFQLTDVGFISGDLQVLPAEADITDPSPNTVIEFLVVGGTPFRTGDQSPDENQLPYRLENASTPIGEAELVFDGTFPAVIRYTLSGKFEGTHVFSVVDGVGTQATGTVVVEFTDVEILPSTATLVTGQSQVFSITGGVPPYTCSASGGTITPNVIAERGGTFTFAAGEVPLSTQFTIVCNDQAGQVATASVTVAPLPTPSGNTGPTPSVAPTPVAGRVVVQANPPSLNGVDGGQSTITANVLDQAFLPLSGVPVLFSLPDPGGDPPPADVPSISPFTGISDANGQVATILTVPGGTPPQFLTVTAETDNGTSGSVTLPITSQRTDPPGPPARISAALFKADACGDNGDGTIFAILSALVIDESGNPVADGVEVRWDNVTPVGAANVLSPSFTNGEPPCDTTPYGTCSTQGGGGLTITPQPGTAITCLIYDANRGGASAAVTATVNGTTISARTNFVLPEQEGPAPTPAPTAQPTPAPTQTPGPPVVVPASATLNVGQSQVFAVTGGVPPYTVNASGGTVSPMTVPSSGGTFSYTATTPGTFTIVVSDSNGGVDTSQVTNNAASAIDVDKPGPLTVAQSDDEVITITGGGTPPYTITLTGGLGGMVSPMMLAAPGSFTYTAPAMSDSGSILISDSGSNQRAISVNVP
jgi:hypothetical protein